jgi:light-independent protochlorophyllide reductase subunit B
MLVGASCTAELIQDDPGGLAKALDLPIPVIPLELPSYQRKENWGAAETFYQLVRTLCTARAQARARADAPARSCNMLGPRRWASATATTCRDHPACWQKAGHRRQRRRPADATPADIAAPEADFNVVLYPETAGQAARWLQRTFGSR